MRKRFCPQISTRLPIIIAAQDGLQVEAQTLQASIKGLALQCNTSERNQVTPGGSFVRDGRPLELFVRLHIPVGVNDTAQVTARCQITYSRRVARDVCHIGLRYVDFESDGGDKLLRFIESRLAVSAA
ncbi:MAG: PilZ domain-containing protein [Gammaproteobacteria bacterium]